MGVFGALRSQILVGLGLGGLALLLLAIWRPGTFGGPGRPDEAGPGIYLDSVTYIFEWRLGTATALPAGGFATTTDRGVKVEVDRLQVVRYSASLVPCETSGSTVGRTLRDSFGRGLVGLLGIPDARAGHVYNPDPSMVDAPTVHAVEFGLPLVYGTRVLPEGGEPTRTRYCRLHVALARAPAKGVDDGMAGFSLHVTGRWFDRQGQPHPIDAKASMANGGFRDLAAVPTGALTVRVHNTVDRLLDGIEFESAAAPMIVRRILGNLIAQMGVEFI